MSPEPRPAQADRGEGGCEEEGEAEEGQRRMGGPEGPPALHQHDPRPALASQSKYTFHTFRRTKFSIHFFLLIAPKSSKHPPLLQLQLCRKVWVTSPLPS